MRLLISLLAIAFSQILRVSAQQQIQTADIVCSPQVGCIEGRVSSRGGLHSLIDCCQERFTEKLSCLFPPWIYSRSGPHFAARADHQYYEVEFLARPLTAWDLHIP